MPLKTPVHFAGSAGNENRENVFMMFDASICRTVPFPPVVSRRLDSLDRKTHLGLTLTWLITTWLRASACLIAPDVGYYFFCCGHNCRGLVEHDTTMVMHTYYLRDAAAIAGHYFQGDTKRWQGMQARSNKSLKGYNPSRDPNS